MPNLPLLLPVLAAGLIVGALLSGRLSRWLSCPRWAAMVLILGLAGIAAVTLTPQQVGAPGEPSWPFGWLLDWLGERVLNVILFVPPGVAVALVGRPRMRRWLMAAALLLPWVVEGIQATVGPLSRDSQWQDVIDNSLGVVLGIVLGIALGRLLRRRGTARQGRPDSSGTHAAVG